MTNDPTHSIIIAYKPKIGIIIVGIVICTGVGIFLVNEAMTNDRGLILEHFITLSPHGAAIFWRVMATLLFCFAALFLLFGLPQVFIPRQIKLDNTSITVPGWGFSFKHYRIDYKDISGVDVSTYRQHVFIKIRHAGGTNSINSGMLPSNDDCVTILNRLRTEMKRPE